MGIVDSAIVVSMAGVVFLTAAIWAFNKQE